MSKFFAVAVAVCCLSCLSFAEEAVMDMNAPGAPEAPAVSQPADAVVPEAPAAVEATQPAGQSALSVEIKIGTAVEDRVVVGEAENYDSAVITKLVCWSRVTGAEEPVQILHKWYLGDKVVSEVTLNVNSSPFRTWSSKTITPEHKGAWKVEVVDPNGVIIGFKTFNVN